ncbi:MAG TPA: trehalose-phosphatase [Candidatus Dormibacteraeota bacterium]|nr:trehalose-phosphatase [Candidatus Dormibacteraeota bacterium]
MSVQSRDVAAVWRGSSLSAIPPKELLLVSDFDGTLSEIVPEPAQAIGLTDSLLALGRLAKVLAGVVILSSRTNTDLAHLVPVPGVQRTGDSGLPKPRGDELRALKRFNVEAAKVLGATPGAWLEIKPASSAIHFRNAAISGEQVLKLLRPLLIETGLYGGLGRKVIEVHSPEATKGHYLASLVERTTPGGVVCLGDDENDRSVFEVASRLTVPHLCVGVGSAEVPPDLFDRCDLILEGPPEAARFLRTLVDWASPPAPAP